MMGTWEKGMGKTYTDTTGHVLTYGDKNSSHKGPEKIRKI